jgi:hypothetical protein
MDIAAHDGQQRSKGDEHLTFAKPKRQPLGTEIEPP